MNSRTIRRGLGSPALGQAPAGSASRDLTDFARASLPGGPWVSSVIASKLLKTFAIRHPIGEKFLIVGGPLFVAFSAICIWTVLLKLLGSRVIFVELLLDPLVLCTVSFISAFFFLIVFALALAGDQRNFKRAFETLHSSRIVRLEHGQRRCERQLREILTTIRQKPGHQVGQVDTLEGARNSGEDPAAAPLHIGAASDAANFQGYGRAAHSFQRPRKSELDGFKRILANNSSLSSQTEIYPEPGQAIDAESFKDALSRGNLQMVAHIACVTDVNAIIDPRRKWTPLHYAAYAASKETVNLLLQLGADPTLRDSARLCPSDIAERTHRTIDICDLLMNAYIRGMNSKIKSIQT